MGVHLRVGILCIQLYNYDNRETPLAGNFVGRCQGHKSDVSTQSWVLILNYIIIIYVTCMHFYFIVNDKIL